MFKKVLIPLDGTLASEQALELAEKLFRGKEREIEVVLLESTADDTFYLGLPVGDEQNIPEHRQAKIKEYIGRTAEVARSWAKGVKEITMIGKPENTIILTAKQEQVDLIVMFTHGYGAFERLIIGSVTDKIAREAPCPILATRDGEVPNHILIALDGTSFSETILDPAFALARLIKADVTLTHIDEAADEIDMRQVARLSDSNRELASTLMSTHNTKYEHYLDEIYQRFIRENDDIKIDYDVASGKPSTEILHVAKYHKCDLIAMATHGRQGLERTWNGSITEDVMHETKTAMLILHPDPI